MPNRTLNISRDSPLHAKLCARIRSRVELARRAHSEQHDTWLKAEELTLAFIPETTEDRTRRAFRESGLPKYTTIQIPYTYALLLSSHTYWTSVFFARTPIHQYSGRHGEGEQQIQALEALIGYQTEVGSHVGPYYIWLYDMGKYGQGVIGEYWDAEVIHYGQIVEMVDPVTQKPQMMQATMEVKGYEGNKLYNVSPYDFMHDPRVPLSRFQEGEFCCSRRRMLWHHIEMRREAGYFMEENIKFLPEHRGYNTGHGGASSSGSDGSSALRRPQFDRELFEDVDITGKSTRTYAGYVFQEVYVQVCPKDWGIGTTSHPQLWCFTITEDLALLVGASPVGYMHGRFPFMVAECEIEGYGIYGRGIPERVEPLQHTMDWLLNTHFFNVRAALNNQFIVDPSKVVIKDAQNAGPGFLWRLRPEAYGTDIRQMFLQVPVTDVTRSNIGDMQIVQGMAERAEGINDQIMGVLNTGSRKTATEVRTSTGFGVNRQKTITEYVSATAFGPHSQRLVQNSQQYYTGEQKLRIAGSFMQEAGASFINVSPENIAGFFDFVPVDGTLPVDRMAQANIWKEILGSLRMMPPQVAMGYDWARIFGWVAMIAGLKNINQFKVQVVPDAQVQSDVASGNVVPLRPPGVAPPAVMPSPVQPGHSASTEAGLNAMGGEGGPTGY